MKKIITVIILTIIIIMSGSVSVSADIADNVPNCYSGKYHTSYVYEGRLIWFPVDNFQNYGYCRLNAPYILLMWSSSDIIDKVTIYIHDHNYNYLTSYNVPTHWYKNGDDYTVYNAVYFVVGEAYQNWNYYYRIELTTKYGDLSGDWAERIHQTIYIGSSELFAPDKGELIDYYIKLGKEQGYAEAGRDWSQRLKEVEQQYYQIGYNDALATSNSQIDALSKIFPSVFGSIFGFLNDIFSIQFWGTSIWEIIMSLASISIMIVVLRLFLK